MSVLIIYVSEPTFNRFIFYEYMLFCSLFAYLLHSYDMSLHTHTLTLDYCLLQNILIMIMIIVYVQVLHIVIQIESPQLVFGFKIACMGFFLYNLFKNANVNGQHFLIKTNISYLSLQKTPPKHWIYH